MGNPLSEEERQKESKSYGDILDEFFPHYLAMGMPAELYWDGESRLKRAYRKAFSLRIENEQRIADRQNWYMGQYIMSALQALPLLVAGLNVKSTTQLPEYPSKPFYETFEEQKKEEVRKKTEEDQTRLAMAMFQAGIAKFNKRFEERQKEQAKQAGTGQ